jgi:hypothetical protein
MGKAIRTVKFADEFVLLAEEETVLRGEIGRLVEIGRCWGTKVKEERTKVMEISSQPSQDTLW